MKKRGQIDVHELVYFYICKNIIFQGCWSFQFLLINATRWALALCGRKPVVCLANLAGIRCGFHVTNLAIIYGNYLISVSKISAVNTKEDVGVDITQQ
jgi:hypothetical protein